MEASHAVPESCFLSTGILGNRGYHTWIPQQVKPKAVPSKSMQQANCVTLKLTSAGLLRDALYDNPLFAKQFLSKRLGAWKLAFWLTRVFTNSIRTPVSASFFACFIIRVQIIGYSCGISNLISDDSKSNSSSSSSFVSSSPGYNPRSSVQRGNTYSD
ncbi:hypothetical protein ACTFIV_007888 [Dictyostelium citrinum]